MTEISEGVGHTPAPAPCSVDCACVNIDSPIAANWEAAVDSDGYAFVHNVGDIICNDDWNHHPGCKVAEKRFRLIAAAPDGLKLAQLIKRLAYSEELSTHVEVSFEHHDAALILAAAEALISKALPPTGAE